MLKEYPLHLDAAIAYARKWALSRNPAYYDFEMIGGDCTNFISQCLFAGGAVMNPTRDTGWYYHSLHDRAAAWTSVQYFYRFMMQNKGVGSFAQEIPYEQAAPGDVLQFGVGAFHHTALVTAARNGMPYLCAHSADVLDVPLAAFLFDRIRCLRIDKARKW